METIVIIGAGAAGLACASTVSRRVKQTNIIVLEQFSHSGKKILASGNGRCNLSNKDMNISYYNTNDKRIEKIIHTFDPVSYFDDIGLVTKYQGNLLYPFSEQAMSVKQVLLDSLHKVTILQDTKVLQIYPKEKGYRICTTCGEFIADYVVYATGSNAGLLSGQDNYQILEELGLSITKLTPSLVQLKTKPVYPKLKGVRVKGEVSLWVDNVQIDRRQGEILFTDTGVSGICIFQLSRKYYAYASKKVLLKMDLFPHKSRQEVDILLKGRQKKFGTSYVKGIFNNKLATVLEAENIPLKNFCLEVIGTNDFTKAQVIQGGLSLEEINEDLECKKYPNLFVIGEVLDVDGDCGGYNLHFAFASGDYVAKTISERANTNA